MVYIGVILGFLICIMLDVHPVASFLIMALFAAGGLAIQEISKPIEHPTGDPGLPPYPNDRPKPVTVTFVLQDGASKKIREIARRLKRASDEDEHRVT